MVLMPIYNNDDVIARRSILLSGIFWLSNTDVYFAASVFVFSGSYIKLDLSQRLDSPFMDKLLLKQCDPCNLPPIVLMLFK